MGRESLILGLAVAFSMAIMGWMVWSERPRPIPVSSDELTTSSAKPPEVRLLDQARVAELTSAAKANADDVDSRLSLANLFFEAHGFEQALPWYEEVLTLRPDDVDSSTNLGISYYYVGSPERAVEQFERSLQIEPSHARTLVSLGIAKAFGLQDLEGATVAWERALEVAPDGPEARSARDALRRLKAAHDATASGGP